MTDQPIDSQPTAVRLIVQSPFQSVWVLGLGAYVLTSLVVVLGAVFGHSFLPLEGHLQFPRGDLLSTFVNWDGTWYTHILQRGYDYQPGTQSTVAFFPAYPLLSFVLWDMLGLRAELALLLVSHLCLAAAFVLLAAYVRRRYPNADPALVVFTLLALGLFPTTMFFRMAYTEALFVCVVVLFLYALERRWPLAIIALIVGFATACRAPGVGLLAPLILHIWERSSSVRQTVERLCLLVPVGCWGLAAWMVYQGLALDEPLAFVKTQANWRIHPDASAADKWADLLSFAPIWNIYDPSSPGYWAKLDPHSPTVFSLQFANPLYFVFAAVVTALGRLRGWLRPGEVVLAGSLLLIPYVASSYENYMAGAARFAAVVVPVYLVLGHLLCRLPRVMSVLLLAISAFLLGTYAALFASWHRVL